MAAVTVEQADSALHQGRIVQQLQALRKDGQLCDLVVKSNDGTEHRAHAAVLCAASVHLKNMLVGPFLEAGQMSQGQPVELAASKAVVSALLEYIYGGQPQMELQDSIELFRLADAYNYPELAGAIETGLLTFLKSAPVAAALQVLQQTQGLEELKATCEEIVAANFESCIELVEFLDLEVSQLARILRREDLSVSREEVVLKGLLKWLNSSKDRSVFTGLLSQHIDFNALSSHSLDRVGHLCASMGPSGHGLQREVDDVLRARKKRRSTAGAADAFRPKRRRLQHWSPFLGASAEGPRKVVEIDEGLVPYTMCLHEGALFISYNEEGDETGSIRSWLPGDGESQAIAGLGASVNGENDLCFRCRVSVSPDGEVFVADEWSDRLFSFQNGTGQLLLENVGLVAVFCSPNGVVYVITERGRSLQKLIGSNLQSVISNENLPEELLFQAHNLFVCKDEVVYFTDQRSSRVFRMNPGETRPTLVAEVPGKGKDTVQGLFVTEGGEIYVGDYHAGKVWSFNPSDSVWTEVVVFPTGPRPMDVLVKGRSLYVIAASEGCEYESGIFEYLLPPEFQPE